VLSAFDTLGECSAIKLNEWEGEYYATLWIDAQKARERWYYFQPAVMMMN
jgi:hypothetical protein